MAPELLEGPGTTTARWEIAHGTSMTLRRNGEPIEIDGGFRAEGSVEVPIEETSVLKLVVAGAVGEPAIATPDGPGGLA